MINSQNTGIFPGTLRHAQDHCTADKSCSGIYHNYCTDQPPFFLCTKNELDLYPFEESTITPLSCVYEKDGKQFFMKNQNLIESFDIEIIWKIQNRRIIILAMELYGYGCCTFDYKIEIPYKDMNEKFNFDDCLYTCLKDPECIAADIGIYYGLEEQYYGHIKHKCRIYRGDGHNFNVGCNRKEDLEKRKCYKRTRSHEISRGKRKKWQLGKGLFLM